MSAYLPAWPWAVLVVAVIIAAVTDLRCGKVFNWLTYPMILGGLFAHALIGGWMGGAYDVLGLKESLFGILWCWPLLVAWLMGGIGGGDVKLQAGIGAVAGQGFALSVLFYGLIVAGLMAIVVMMYRRRAKETLGRVFRFLVLAAVRAKPGDPSVPDSPTIPFAFALCLGTVAAGVQWLITGELVQLF
jgi:prepilin peptidase CpaA